jgi:hypothetical protein
VMGCGMIASVKGLRRRWLFREEYQYPLSR